MNVRVEVGGTVLRGRGGAVWSRRTVGGALALVLTGSLAGAPAAQPAQAIDLLDCSATSVSTEAVARDTALACGTEVAVESLTDPWSTTTILSDGYAKLSSSVDAVRAPDLDDTDGDGTPWQPVDAALVAEPLAGRIVMAAPAADLTFSAGDTDGSGSGGPLASLTTTEGHTVTVDVPFDLPAPVVDVTAGQVVYPLADGVDVVVTPNSDGTSFSEVIRADSADALRAVPQLESLTGEGLVFPVTVSDGLDLRPTATGGFDVTETATAQVVAELPAAKAWDSAADAVLEPAPEDALAQQSTDLAARSTAPESTVLVAPDGELIAADGVDERRASAPVAGDAVETLNAELVTGARVPSGADAGVAVRLDEGTLAGMDGAVHIDPTTGTKRPGGKAVIQSAYPSSVHYNDATSFPIGACTASIGCPTTNVVRSAFQWTGLTSISGLRGSDIREATFTVFGSHSYACSSRVTQLYRTTAISGSTTWNNFSASSRWQSKVDEKNVHHKSVCNNDRDIAWNVASVARWAADNNSARITLGLKGTSTSDVYTWKRYENPRLEITYNRAPKVPSSGEMKLLFEGQQPEACSGSSGAPSFPTTSGVTMRGVARDADSPQVRVKFMVLTSGGTKVYETGGWTAWKAPAATFEKSIPSSALSGGGTFQWRMIVQDQFDNSGDRTTTWTASPKCYFKVDLTNPSTPSISSSQYPEGEISGGVGVGGSFVLDSRSSDVVTYKYSINSDGLGSSRAPSSPGGPVTVSYRIDRSGPYVLYAQAVDSSGRTSGTRTYRFTVDFPTTAGYWHMDEFAPISGSTALSTADDGALGHTLRVSSGVGLTSGPFALAQIRPEDQAMVFDGTTSDTAFTSGRVVNMFGCASDTTGPDGVPDGKTEDQGLKAGQCTGRTGEGDYAAGFTVSAFVRADDVAADWQTAVSQDGEVSSGFRMERVPGDGRATCPDGLQTCWAFRMYNSDGGSSVAAMSDRPVTAGEWVHLAGVFNGSRGELSLSVCPVPVDPDGRDPEGTGIPVVDPAAGTADYTGAAWTAGGAVQVGRSQVRGTLQDHWHGAIDEVRLYNAPLGNGQISRICTGDMTGGFTPGAELETGEGEG